MTTPAPDVMAAQIELCKRKHWPLFLMERCPSCGKDTTVHPRVQAEAATQLITGCYYCNYSFCE